MSIILFDLFNNIENFKLLLKIFFSFDKIVPMEKNIVGG